MSHLEYDWRTTVWRHWWEELAQDHYLVLIIDNFHMDPDEDYAVGGFPTLELAMEFARRWTRDSIEEQRAPNQNNAQLRQSWHAFGECASVIGADYSGHDEIEYFIEHPASPEEVDWQAVKRDADVPWLLDDSGVVD